ncbi:MAG: DUF5667 domain-containing protein [bacterium]|nr:DUF5667 domain-containing protein [bacterium]
MDNLLKKLNNLKSIQPDSEWKNRCREILFSQISNGQTAEELEQEKLFSWKIFFGDLLPQWTMARPALVGYFAIVLLISSGLASVYASNNTKPGDSLYIAKIINEKAQFAITFDEKEKTKLNLEFAVNRAEEINQLLEKSTAVESIKQDKDKQDKDEKVQKLTSSFKKEINQAKTRISKINIVRTPIIDTKNQNQNNDNEKQQFFGANLGRDNQRIEISEPIKANVKKSNQVVREPQIIVANPVIENLEKDSNQEANKILEQAEKLFDEKKYNESINKINEVNTAVSQTNVEVVDKTDGASKPVSTTTEVK